MQGCQKGDLKEEKYQNGGQLQKDLIDAIVAKKNGDPITVKWAFDGRIKEENLDSAINAILEKFQTSPTFRNGFLQQLQMPGLNAHKSSDGEAIRRFFSSRPDGELRQILAEVLKM